MPLMVLQRSLRYSCPILCNLTELISFGTNYVVGSEDHTASTFIHHREDGRRSFETMVSYWNSTRCHNAKDLNLSVQHFTLQSACLKRPCMCHVQNNWFTSVESPMKFYNVQEISFSYRTQTFITVLKKVPQVIPVSTELSPVHIFTAHSCKIHFSTILPPTYIYYPKWTNLLSSSDRNVAHISHFSHPCYMSCPFLIIWRPYNFMWKVKII